jgi:hypothetical protein
LEAELRTERLENKMKGIEDNLKKL